jgi:hypothetical protein
VHAEQSQLADLHGEVADGHLTGLEPLRDVRAQPGLAELPDHGAQFEVLGRQQRVEVEETFDRRGHAVRSTPALADARHRYPER